jgi:hypothetical protein
MLQGDTKNKYDNSQWKDDFRNIGDFFVLTRLIDQTLSYLYAFKTSDLIAPYFACQQPTMSDPLIT